MKLKFKYIISTLLIAVSLTGCQTNGKRADIVTSLYPQFDIVKKVAQDKLTVSLLPPLGGEIHDYSPLPSDVRAINNSKLFIYTSSELEPWIKNINKSVNALNLSSMDVSDLNIDFSLSLSHYWTDPLIYLEMLETITSSLVLIDPDNAIEFQENKETYKNEIMRLDEEFKTFLAPFGRPKLYFAGHNALEPFKKRYNLDLVSFSDGFQPDADITPLQLLKLKKQILENNIHYLFIEELVDPKAALTLKQDLALQNYSLELLVLHGFHNITLDEYQKGVSYADIFAQNIANIQQALSN